MTLQPTGSETPTNTRRHTRVIAALASAVVVLGAGTVYFAARPDGKAASATAGGNPFPGYPTTGQTEAFVKGLVADKYGPAATMNYLQCQYFLVSAGPPPLWDCKVRVTADGQDTWHDNLQITGRPDQTWACEDDSQVESPLC